MANLYPFTSPLDALVFDVVADNNKPSALETEANLALWTNAQFTFDVQPGSGILEDKPDMTSPSTTSSSPLTASTAAASPEITYENLANYLDYELPKQQQQQLQLQSLQSLANLSRQAHQQILLPKILPAMTLEEITKALSPNTSTNDLTVKPIDTQTKTSAQLKRSASPAEKGPAEEDKRRRNTAASARFRIKKKLREQTMEKTVREMTEKSNGLEDRVKELELEIKWLRRLLLEKGTSTPDTMEIDRKEGEEVPAIKSEL